MDEKNSWESEWTYSEYARLPDDGNRYEVIDGEVCMTPSPGPRHQEVAARLFMRLYEHVQRYALGRVFWDLDVLFVTAQFLRPDMVYVPASALSGITDRGVESVPGLVVEVLSPHSKHIDRVRKPPRYRDFGIPEYWVVDPVARAIERYRLADGLVLPEVCTGALRWQPDIGVPALDIEVAEIFAGV